MQSIWMRSSTRSFLRKCQPPACHEIPVATKDRTVSGQEDGKQREDTREGNRGHIDNRAVDRRSMMMFKVDNKGRAPERERPLQL